MGAASKLAQLNGRLVEKYMTVAVIYLVICSLTSQLVSYLRQRTQIQTSR